MIDIVRDYAAIGMGTAQAATGRVVRLGRAGVDRAIAVGTAQSATLGEQISERPSLGEAAQRGRELLAGLVNPDVDGLIHRLGLAKGSELHAVRQQMHRLERRIGEARGDR